MARSGFIVETGRRLVTGGLVYYLWMTLLTVLAAIGIASYVKQLQVGLIATGMQNYVSWGLYIGNFTFLVGVAAAAVLLIIPAYLYDFGPIKEVVVVAEVLAVCALVDVPDVRDRRLGTARQILASHSRPGNSESAKVFVGLGYCGPERLSFPEHSHSGLSSLERLSRPTGQYEVHPALHPLVDPMGGEHPHGHSLYLQRTCRTPLLERIYPCSTIPCFRILLGSSPGDIALPTGEKIHDISRQG